MSETPQAASEDLLARVIQAVGEQEERQTLDLIVQQLADPATEGRAAARLLRTAAVRLAAADLNNGEDVRHVTHDVAATLTTLVDLVRSLFTLVDVDDNDLGQTVDALESAAGGMRALDRTQPVPHGGQSSE